MVGLDGYSYNTIDRRLRDGKTPDQILVVGRTANRTKSAPKITEGKGGVTAENVHCLRTDYKAGIGKLAILGTCPIADSQYWDIIANRTWKSRDGTWWRE